MAALDPRTTPARADVAAAHLEGLVASARFEPGVLHQAVVPATAIRRAPNAAAIQETQLLFGEAFLVYDQNAGWAWGQSGIDDYVGYVEAAALAAPPAAPTHRVSAVRAAIYADADPKASVQATLAMNALVTVEAEQGGFARLLRGGWISARAIAPIAAKSSDWVSVAEQFLGAPYVWGGRENIGLDCSGLVQTALLAAGVSAPRDSDMMEEALGAPLAPGAPLRRGDLVFWAGHVGIMLDGARLLHANAHHMAAAIEPLAEAEARIWPVGGPIRIVRRLP